jgi:hypothetical protein
MLLGANAGATLALWGQTWGPAPETQIPIWYTTMVDACAGAKTSTTVAPTVTGTAAVRRDDAGLTTTSKVVTYTAIQCLSTGLINCPASLQSTTRNTVTKTLVTTVPTSGDAFPATTQIAVVSAVAFGKNFKEMSATTGSPVSYIPQPSSTSSTATSGKPAPTGAITSILGGETRGVSNKVIIGVSVGVGVPVLILIIAGCL